VGAGRWAENASEQVDVDCGYENKNSEERYSSKGCGFEMFEYPACVGLELFDAR